MDTETSLKQWHKIIHDPDDIKQFASIFSIRKRNLALCMYLTARRKYFPSLTAGTLILQRPIVTGGEYFEGHLYQNVLRLETPIGSYLDKDNILPTEALALYVLIDPKDTIKAMSKTLTTCVETFTNGEELPNAYKLYREEISKCNINNVKESIKYRQIDIDTKQLEYIIQTNDLLTKLNIPIILCVETRGGFHIVYSPDLNNSDKNINQSPEGFKQNSKDIGRSLHEFKQTTMFTKPNINGKMVKDYWFSITNQPNIIMPGTYQGGFPTRIITLSDWIKDQLV